MTLKDRIKPTEPKYCVFQLAAELFESRTQAHKEHLKTTSFAFHKATNDYYDAIVDLTDGLVESMQGYEGIKEIPDFKIKNTNFVQYLKELDAYCTNVQSACKYSNIINEIDNVKTLIASTLYKIINLK